MSETMDMQVYEEIIRMPFDDKDVYNLEIQE